jgi:hypothetical protein
VDFFVKQKTRRIEFFSGEKVTYKNIFLITPNHFLASEENGYITTSPFYYYEVSRGYQ